MKIDNKKHIYRIWIRKLIFTIFFIASIIAVMFLNIFDNPETGITKYHIVITISVIFIIISAIAVMRNPYYFYFDDISEVLMFKYYPVGLFNSQKNSLQIPKKHFIKFETQTFFFGLEEKIILFQLYRNKVAKYPPISLSALTKSEREKLKNTLHRYSQKK